jgi:hypothetical protein
MDDIRKLRILEEDYERTQQALDELSGHCNAYESYLGRRKWISRCLIFMGRCYDLGRRLKTAFTGGTGRAATGREFVNNVRYKDTLALYDYKIAVYTCITGNYDLPLEPQFKPGNLDYILVTDGPLPSSGAWKGVNIHEIKGLRGLDIPRMARYVKLHPHLFLGDYDYSIYIDGNIKTIGDMRYLIHLMNRYGFVSVTHRSRECIKEELKACIELGKEDPRKMREQVDSYLRAGMPEKYGLIEANLLVRDHHNPVCMEIMERWWSEIERHSRRDQLSLPFVLWEMGIPTEEIGIVCNNIYRLPSVAIASHSKKRAEDLLLIESIVAET